MIFFFVWLVTLRLVAAIWLSFLNSNFFFLNLGHILRSWNFYQLKEVCGDFCFHWDWSQMLGEGHKDSAGTLAEMCWLKPQQDHCWVQSIKEFNGWYLFAILPNRAYQNCWLDTAATFGGTSRECCVSEHPKTPLKCCWPLQWVLYWH